MLNRKMPYEALYGHAPDLSNLWLWGCTVLGHKANSSKLDAHTREVRWLGFDIDAHAHHVYWPGPGNVTIEHNVYFGMSAQLEGEESTIPTIRSKQSATPSTPLTPA